VGAVIVGADGRIAATGYNGPPAQWEPAAESPNSSCRSWCSRSDTDHDQNFDHCPSVHAELNALLYCDRDQARGGTIYVTKSPCMTCCKAIAAAGVVAVVWPGYVMNERRGIEANHFLRRCGIYTREPNRYG
jgi:dCMP deaminase